MDCPFFSYETLPGIHENCFDACAFVFCFLLYWIWQHFVCFYDNDWKEDTTLSFPYNICSNAIFPVSRGSFHYITYNPCSKQHFLPDHSTSIFLTNSNNFLSNERIVFIHLILTHILKERSFPSLLTLWWLSKHILYNSHHSLMFRYVEKLVR